MRMWSEIFVKVYEGGMELNLLAFLSLFSSFLFHLMF